MADKPSANPRVNKLIELEVGGRIKPEHQQELDTYRAQGLAPKKASNTGTEGERKASAFLTRAIGSNRSFEDQKIGPRGLIGQNFRDAYPNAANYLASDERQIADSAQDEFIAASLRQDSGAAIPEEELERQRRIYFPMPGDGDDVIKQKREARLRALDGLVQAAGGMLTSDQRSALSALRPDISGAVTGEAPVDKTSLGTPEFTDSAAARAAVNPMNEQQQAAYDAFMTANPKASADQITQFANSMGVTLDNIPAIVEARDKGAGLAPAGSARFSAPDISDARGAGGVVEGADAFMRGVADTGSLGFADEISAAGRTVFGDGTMAENLARERAIDAYDSENSPWLRGSGQFTGGAMFPLGRGATTMRELAGVGGATGAAYGLGSGTNMQDRLTGAGVGGVTGAALGASLGKLSDLYRGRRGPPPPGGGAAALDQASSDLNIPLMAADVGGTPASMASSFFRMTPGGAQPITAAARRSQEAAGDALGSIAAREGVAMDREAAGQAVREGALAYRDSSRDAIGRLYKRAADEAGDARVSPQVALDRLDGNIAELSEVPGGAEGLSILKGLRDDIANRGTISVNGIRGMRTQLRQKFAKDGLRGSDIERRVNDVIDAASQDLVRSLETQGKSAAAKAYREADAQWAERIKTLDDTIMPIIGKKGEKSGEQITDALNAAAKGNNARLSKLFDSLPPEEAGAARATMIEGLGRASAGAQNASGDTFSFASFLTNWNKIGNSAKNAIFSGENRKAIDQLALIAEKSKNASRFQNYSNTGIGVLGVATGATSAGGPAALAGTLAGQYAFGRLLASPRVARAILKIAQAKTPEAVRTRINGLSNVAARDAALAPEISGLQQRLMSAMNDNVSSAAAREQEDGR